MFADVNGDGKADFCRMVGGATTGNPIRPSCLLADNTPVPPTNTPPTCNNFSLTLNSGNSATLDFTNKVSDAQDAAANLKIKLYALPTCGSITNANGITATSGQNYNVSELTYKACSPNNSTQDTISYSVVDTGSLVSSNCSIGISITPTSSINPAPTCNSFSLTLNSGSSNTLNFTSYVSDAQDPTANLKIKLNTLPSSCGSITSANGSAAVSGQSYSVSELIYKACSTNITTQDTMSYSVVDTGSLESSKCSIGISINAAPPTNTTNNYCLKLKTLSLGSVGDLDRKNEEIELEITSLNKQLDCGIFLFDIVKNVKDKNLNINIPCNSGDFVDVRFIERDNCNDDMTLKKIQCTVTGQGIQLPIQITPDNTATSYTQCISSTKEIQACGDVNLGIVGGSFCSAYTWGKEECGTTQVSETASEYILVYEVVNQGCDFSATNLQRNEYCYYDHYIPGPTCNTSPTTSDATTLDYSTALMAFSALTLFFD
jgi:hypothetical protein